MSFIWILITPKSVGAVEVPNQGGDIFLPLIINGSTNSAMINIPAGEFQMGCDPNHNGGNECWEIELPLHTVYLDTYSIDKYEVTNVQMASFLNNRGNNDCSGDSCVNIDHFSSRISWNGSQYIISDGYSDHPVVDVTWNGANTFCLENNKRLPTEAEWEKAARGTTPQAFPWGDELPNCDRLNFYDDFADVSCVSNTTQVGSYPTGVSPYGVFDMAGNAWEWVADWYLWNYYSISPINNPIGPATGTYRVLRGGSWNFYGGAQLTSARHNTSFAPPVGYIGNIGFRCVKDVP
jgi:formylglycine-generating enzyme